MGSVVKSSVPSGSREETTLPTCSESTVDRICIYRPFIRIVNWISSPVSRSAWGNIHALRETRATYVKRRSMTTVSNHLSEKNNHEQGVSRKGRWNRHGGGGDTLPFERSLSSQIGERILCSCPSLRKDKAKLHTNLIG